MSDDVSTETMSHTSEDLAYMSDVSESDVEESVVNESVATALMTTAIQITNEMWTERWNAREAGFQRQLEALKAEHEQRVAALAQQIRDNAIAMERRHNTQLLRAIRHLQRAAEERQTAFADMVLDTQAIIDDEV